MMFRKKDPHSTNALFKKGVCNTCKGLSRCPVSQHKRHNKLNFTRKDMAVARRRVEQETLEPKNDNYFLIYVVKTIGYKTFGLALF
jgi:hypothetical protein